MLAPAGATASRTSDTYPDGSRFIATIAMRQSGSRPPTSAG
jgi:hypothetical protein